MDLQGTIDLITEAVGKGVELIVFPEIGLLGYLWLGSLAAINYAKAIVDPIGYYSRPDVSCLLFNPLANRPLSIKATPFIALTDIQQVVLLGSEDVPG
ncbi:MAG TPA: hypothetical protein ACHBX0_05105 [Arsenophonus sp.]